MNVPPSTGTTTADLIRLTNAGLAALPTDSATIACGYGLRPTSTTVQQTHVAPLSSSLAQPPGGHLRQPLNIESLHAAVAAAQGASSTPDPQFLETPQNQLQKGERSRKGCNQHSSYIRRGRTSAVTVGLSTTIVHCAPQDWHDEHCRNGKTQMEFQLSKTKK